jgi:predicted methyltransferase MtxX (methanogen marker protein 4)
MIDTFTSFDQKVEALAGLRKPKIAFGLEVLDAEIIQSLTTAKQYADIILVGPPSLEDVAGFTTVTDDDPASEILELLTQGKIEGFIRGTIDDFKTRDAYAKHTGEVVLSELCLLEDVIGRKFFLGAASNPDGWTTESKLHLTKQFVDFCHDWDIVPRVAVLTGVRHDTYTRKQEITDGIEGILNQTYIDAEWLVKTLSQEGVETKNWAIDSDIALQEGYNIIIAPNGMVGNQMFRMILATGGRILFGTHLQKLYPYEDNSRNEKDFVYHVKWLVALINKRRKNGQR